MPSGNETTMPTEATTMVTSTPPHKTVSTGGSPIAAQPVQQDERRDGQHHEEINGADIAPRRVEPQQPDNADRQHREENIDSPALGDRIGAVDEIRQPLPHERPAGADFAMLHGFEAGVAVGAAPHRVDQQKLDQLRDDPGKQQRDDDRERDVERRRQQVRAQPAERAAPSRPAAAAAQ